MDTVYLVPNISRQGGGLIFKGQMSPEPTTFSGHTGNHMSVDAVSTLLQKLSTLLPDVSTYLKWM
jgi:hypothetical protein